MTSEPKMMLQIDILQHIYCLFSTDVMIKMILSEMFGHQIRDRSLCSLLLPRKSLRLKCVCLRLVLDVVGRTDGWTDGWGLPSHWRHALRPCGSEQGWMVMAFSTTDSSALEGTHSTGRMTVQNARKQLSFKPLFLYTVYVSNVFNVILSFKCPKIQLWFIFNN